MPSTQVYELGIEKVPALGGCSEKIGGVERLARPQIRPYPHLDTGSPRSYTEVKTLAIKLVQQGQRLPLLNFYGTGDALAGCEPPNNLRPP